MNITNGRLHFEATSRFTFLLSTFLEQKLRVTIWIEAFWIFTSCPSLATLTEELCCSENTHVQHEISKYPTMTANLKACDTDLCRLHREWGHLLSLNPNAILRSSITAFTKSGFLYETGDTIVSSLAPPEVLESSQPSEDQVAQSAILVQPQVSDSGLILGIIFVLPSRDYITGSSRAFSPPQSRKALPPLTRAQRQRFIRVASRGWKVKYQQRSTLTESVLLEIEHEPPEQDVYQLLCQSLSSNQPDCFPFPIAFSKDLRRIVILRTLLTLVNTGDAQNSSINRDFKVQGQLHDSTKSRDDTMNIYSPTFSPTGNALTLVIGVSKEIQLEQRLIEIWSQNELDIQGLDYLLRRLVMTSCLNVIKSDSHVSFGFIFRPWLPIVAVSEWMRISAWWFNDQSSKQRIYLASHSGIPRSFPDTNRLRLSYVATTTFR
ncbi:hypothetical protein HD806DRAFT_360928 [Xylariaceae sp. AK1471]|nr:hypothetical protein HD806DRAFT_360928 [Xylariaceae sp. AK1471]